jgi:predicted glycoside hydrolase/deacetylase ChbG (UPF0249 family)
MRYLIVNADDFGASTGVNHGIARAHRRGIVTSASLMVGMPGSDEAASLARECSELSTGLHVWFAARRGQPATELSDPAACRVSVEAQLVRFSELMGRPPTHLDSHHHVHTDPILLPCFRDAAERLGIPLRDCSGVRYCSSFYGQWAGESHRERVSVAGLIGVLSSEVGEGVTELGCHPGCGDSSLVSSYTVERELELQTLCDRRVRDFLDERGIALIRFGEVPRLVGASN